MMRTGEVDMGNAFAGFAPVDDGESPEIEAIRAAIDALPPDTGPKLLEMFSCNGLTLADLDVKSVMELARLHITLQAKVLQHMQNERVFLCNSRSKSRFLISTCERAKQGALDVRGFGAIDPWKTHLNSIAVCAVKTVDLVPELEYMEQNGGRNTVIALSVDCAVCDTLKELSPIELTFPATSPVEELKEKLFSMGCTFPVNQIKIRVQTDNEVRSPSQPANWNCLGFLKNQYSFAYYNFPTDGRPVKVRLEKKARGGLKFRRDYSSCTELPKTRPSLLAANMANNLPTMMQNMLNNFQKMMKRAQDANSMVGSGITPVTAPPAGQPVPVYSEQNPAPTEPPPEAGGGGEPGVGGGEDGGPGGEG